MDATARAALIGGAIALALVFVLAPLAMMAGCGMMMGIGGVMDPGGMGGMMGQPMPMMGGMGWPMLLFGLVVVVGVVLLLVWGISKLGDRTYRGEDPPLTILQRRYARGEIGREEYEQARADLGREGHG